MIYFLGLLALVIALGIGYALGTWDEAARLERHYQYARDGLIVRFRVIDDTAPSGSKLTYTTIEELTK